MSSTGNHGDARAMGRSYPTPIASASPATSTLSLHSSRQTPTASTSSLAATSTSASSLQQPDADLGHRCRRRPVTRLARRHRRVQIPPCSRPNRVAEKVLRLERPSISLACVLSERVGLARASVGRRHTARARQAAHVGAGEGRKECATEGRGREAEEHRAITRATRSVAGNTNSREAAPRARRLDRRL